MGRGGHRRWRSGQEAEPCPWDTDSGGPARRIYRLSEQGDRYLASWVQDLRETDRVLNHFLETYDAHMQVHA